MKRQVTVVLTVVVSMVLLSAGFVYAVDAPSTKGKWGVGMRGGISVYTQELTDTSNDPLLMSC